jgi:hypothetical protein
LIQTLRDLDLRPVASLDRKQRTTKWTMGSGGPKVEFLVPRMKEDSEFLKLKPLAVYAQALPFLDFLIADPIPAIALYRSGLLVQVPRPERYAVHKLIVASRRHASSALKANKDIAQAELLMTVLSEDRPAELATAYSASMNKGPKWRDALSASVGRSERITALLAAL